MATKDEESGKSGPPAWLRSYGYPYDEEPVGGWPGNPKFKRDVLLALRTAFFACCLSAMIWVPETKPYAPQEFLPYIPLSVLMIFFTMNEVFGGIIANATAAIIGTFWAVFNVFMLRGFFPDGVQPGMGYFSSASVVGWSDIAIFNLVFLVADVRMGTRMFAMGSNTGFMLAFLNPNDKSIYSKNFVINPNGIAVTVLKVTTIACFLTMLANLLPVPFKFATADMKENAKRVSTYVTKNIIACVDYYRGDKASLVIEQQMAKTEVLENEINSLPGSIDCAWYEGMDLGIAGIVRKCHERHAGMMTDLLVLTKAMEIAIAQEDFGDSHKQVMEKIGPACDSLADATGELLMFTTACAADGDISREERRDMINLEDKVKQEVMNLATDFNEARQMDKSWKKIEPLLLQESFFVFALSAYSRKVLDYADDVRTNPPEGKMLVELAWQGIKATFTLQGIPESHWKIAARSWIALMIGFSYAVLLDNYSGACAITLVFLMSTKVAPDVNSSLKGLVAATVASVASAILYSRACQTGIGNYLLPFLALGYWTAGLYMSFSGCEFALIGLLAAALSPFLLVVRCPPPDEISGSANALGLWISIRGFMIALFLMSLAEFLSADALCSKIAYQALDKGFGKIMSALKKCFDEKDPQDEIADLPGFIAKAKLFGASAREEPRLTKCRWKLDLLNEVARWMEIAALDVAILRMAMVGADGKTHGVFKVIRHNPDDAEVGPFEKLTRDLVETLTNARDLSIKLLAHDVGIFTMVDDPKFLGNLHELDGFKECMEDINSHEDIEWPVGKIHTIEDDLLCQISIIFVMLEYITKRAANIIESCVREA
jgi:hypothetical protein